MPFFQSHLVNVVDIIICMVVLLNHMIVFHKKRHHFYLASKVEWKEKQLMEKKSAEQNNSTPPPPQTMEWSLHYRYRHTGSVAEFINCLGRAGALVQWLKLPSWVNWEVGDRGLVSHSDLNLFTTIHDGNFRRHSSMNVTIKWHKFSSNIYYIYVFFVIWSWKLR